MPNARNGLKLNNFFIDREEGMNMVETESWVIQSKIDEAKKKRNSALARLWFMAKANVNQILCHDLDKTKLFDMLPVYLFREMAKLIPLKCEYSIDLTTFNGVMVNGFVMKDVNECWRINDIRTLHGKNVITEINGKEFREMITMVQKAIEEDAETIRNFNPRQWYQNEIAKKLQNQLAFLE